MKLIFVKRCGDVMLETSINPNGKGYAEITEGVSNGIGGYNMVSKRTVAEAEAKEIAERLVKKDYYVMRG